ncbi:PTS sugar transporter subunit IIA [Paenibacillus sp. WST5]|uniref:Mannitol-specific phosphotransferase enzyme IIA component n=2 Tax=Paenibacillus sedimenti TaxID=2770274 RepID=A0A926KNY7_9BACL|nr:PTS sugar transporter subunit IIA [Paenibacillus sedimenti]
MVFQNVACLVALGMLRVLFGPLGWWPQQGIHQLIDPLTIYFIPLLFAYTGGRMMGGHRGGVVSAFVVLGMIAGNTSSYSMILPAMLVSPVMGYIIKKVDKWLEAWIPLGLELLCYTVAAGAISIAFALVAFYEITPLFVHMMSFIAAGAEQLVASGYLWPLAIIIEPAKVLFFNNVINHGILEPLGINQARELGKSIFFLLETNPGPGLGLLLAYYLHAKGMEKGNVRSSLIIHVLGGIHEVYFPYAILKPVTIIPLIIGGVAGDFVFAYLNAGLVATPSPGSIMVLMFMAPKGMHMAVLAGFLVSAFISFLGCYLVISKSSSKISNHTQSVREVVELQMAADGNTMMNKRINKIVFACDAGMGSSAMGAALLRKKLKESGLFIEVTNCSVDELSSDADIVISHTHLTERAKLSAPSARHFSITSFLDKQFYEDFISKIGSGFERNSEDTSRITESTVFTMDHILLQMSAKHKEEAIEQIGEALIRLSHTEPMFIQELHQREKMLSTYIGNGVAIPHGVNVDSKYIRKPGIVITQYPNGIDYGNGKTAYLLIAVVGHHQEKPELISRIAYMIESKQTVDQMIKATSKKEVYELVCKSFKAMDGKR